MHIDTRHSPDGDDAMAVCTFRPVAAFVVDSVDKSHVNTRGEFVLLSVSVSHRNIVWCHLCRRDDAGVKLQVTVDSLEGGGVELLAGRAWRAAGHRQSGGGS